MGPLDESAPGDDPDESGGSAGQVMEGPGSASSGSSGAARPVTMSGAGTSTGGSNSSTTPAKPSESPVVPVMVPIARDAGLPSEPLPTQPPWVADASVLVTDGGLVPAANPCSVPSSWQADAWVPHPGFAGDIQALFDHTKRGVLGTWHGLAATPWIPPYEVDLEFRSDGSYTSRCTTGSGKCCVALYYGTDEDTPLKRYRIEDATLSGNVVGEIDVAFGYGPGSFGLPAWQGELARIELDASGNGLRFEFRTSDNYGPVRFDLRRVGQP